MAVIMASIQASWSLGGGELACHAKQMFDAIIFYYLSGQCATCYLCHFLFLSFCPSDNSCPSILVLTGPIIYISIPKPLERNFFLLLKQVFFISGLSVQYPLALSNPTPPLFSIIHAFFSSQNRALLCYYLNVINLTDLNTNVKRFSKVYLRS
jgi:hypothetical protein